MRKKAYAKLTLYLHAKDRKDGVLHFQNITVPIDLFDMVYLDKHETMHIETDKTYLPNDKRNTVYKTLMILKRTYKISDNFKVRIVKNIPKTIWSGWWKCRCRNVIHMINDMYQLQMSDQAMIDVAKHK
ncbi:hypothetical protein MGH68_00815 [Erysipelothrix sp. D19-032]